VPSAAFAALTEDDLVTRRASELEAAELQREARAAARKQDWATVDRLVAKSAELGEANAWLADVALEMRSLSLSRDEMSFAKEAAYSSRRMNTRLASRSEAAEPEIGAPSFLRRKRAQGKAAPDSADKQ
jgi:hypothetical protein